MAELRNCAECGRLFAYQGRNICSRCLEKEDEQYTIVRKYVRDHSGASIFEVADATGVEEDKILQFLRDGRLESKGFTNVLECERCGRQISSGRYCQRCLAELGNELKEALPADKHKDDQISHEDFTRRKNERMHIKEGNYK